MSIHWKREKKKRTGVGRFGHFRFGFVASFQTLFQFFRFHLRRFAIEDVNRFDAVLDHSNRAIEHSHQMARRFSIFVRESFAVLSHGNQKLVDRHRPAKRIQSKRKDNGRDEKLTRQWRFSVRNNWRFRHLSSHSALDQRSVLPSYEFPSLLRPMKMKKMKLKAKWTAEDGVVCTRVDVAVRELSLIHI